MDSESHRIQFTNFSIGSFCVILFRNTDRIKQQHTKRDVHIKCCNGYLKKLTLAYDKQMLSVKKIIFRSKLRGDRRPE